MADPNYQPVRKDKFKELKASFAIYSKDELVTGIRGLFDEAEGQIVMLKKDDTLNLADRLEAEGPGWSRSGYAERPNHQPQERRHAAGIPEGVTCRI